MPNPGQAGLYQSGRGVSVKATKTGANQTLTTAVAALISFAGEDFDTHGMHDTVTNNSRLTTVIPGLYIVGWCIPFAPSATGIRTIELLVNGAVGGGTEGYGFITMPNNGASSPTINTGSMLLRLNAGDYLELRATQTSGGNLDVYLHTFSGPTVFWAVRLGP